MLAEVEQARLRIAKNTQAEHKSRLGQLFTPAATARFMTGLFPPLPAQWTAVCLTQELASVRFQALFWNAARRAACASNALTRLSFPLFFVFQPDGIMPPILVHAER